MTSPLNMDGLLPAWNTIQNGKCTCPDINVHILFRCIGWKDNCFFNDSMAKDNLTEMVTIQFGNNQND